METTGTVNPDAGFALIVNYLPPSYNDHDLHRLFSDIGALLSAKVMRNKVGNGIVTFFNIFSNASVTISVSQSQCFVIHHSCL